MELRLAAIGAAGIALLGVGFQKRSVKPVFALVLQGAGVAVMYLTVLAAIRLYHLVPALAAFVLMGLVCAVGRALPASRGNCSALAWPAACSRRASRS